MPYVRKRRYRKRRWNNRRRNYARKSYARKSYTRNAGNNQVISGGRLLPEKSKYLFKYAEKVSIDPPTGGLSSSYFISTNSLFDPNRSGVGHQPYGFDEFMTFYDHYTVIGSKITITLLNTGSTSTDTYLVAITERDTTSAVADITHLIEMGNSTYATIAAANGSSGVATLTHRSNPAKFLGRSAPLADPDLKGTVSSSPVEESFFEINVANFSIDDPPTIDVLINVEYIAVLTEPKKFTQS